MTELKIAVSRQRLRVQINRLPWIVLEWLYPPYCGGCGKFGKHWCSECQDKTLPIGKVVCVRCGTKQMSIGLCPQCKLRSPAYTSLRSWAVYSGPIKNAIHRIKYRRDIALGEVLSEKLIAVYNEQDWMVDLVVPVPIGIARLKERGYNQAALLARPFAIAMGLKYEPKTLRKTRETHSQVDLSLCERLTNLIGAFQAKSILAQGKNILVIDDVTTSGATMQTCAEALLEVGALNVFGLTVARTLF